MEIVTHHRLLACDWCATPFERRHRGGRIPRYCKRTCRQRAYEHRRRGAQWPQHPHPTHPPREPWSEPPRFYEGATTMRGKCLRHAIRPYTPPDARGMRATLCGTRARIGKTPFMPYEWAACATCQRVALAFPPAKAVDSSNDLAHLLAELEHLRQQAAVSATIEDIRSLVEHIWQTALTHTGIGDQRLPPALRTAA